jgi:hypothetical protein
MSPADLTALLARARAIAGLRVPLRGPETHKGRIGEGIERMLLGANAGPSHAADHPDAEVKSVPVLGDRVVERVKLGVLSANAHPLDKCARVLFVFVEWRGADVFVMGHACVETPRAAWLSLWRRGHLVETAAGVSGDETRGLYLTPSYFYDRGLWPPALDTELAST